jgi:hypothetical protein
MNDNKKCVQESGVFVHGHVQGRIGLSLVWGEITEASDSESVWWF